MNDTRPALRRVAFTALALLVAAYAGYRFARYERAAPPAPSAPATVASEEHAHAHQAHPAPAPATAERRVLYWYDPMRPDQHFERPGKSPFMDMDLVPRYAEPAPAQAASDLPSMPLQPVTVQSVKAVRGRLDEALVALGELAFNQRDVAVVQARADAFVTRGFGLAPGDVVPRGAALVELEVPAWIAAQREYLAVLDLRDPALAAAARARLELLGMPAEVLTRLTETRAIVARVVLRSPLAGVVTALEARVGMRVAAGTTLVAINGLDPLWLEIAVPEAQATGLSAGTPLRAEVAGHAGEVFAGVVEQVLPAADGATRNLRLRARVDNPDGRLRAGLSARVRLDRQARDAVLLLPSTAVIRGGRRNLVLRRAPEGRYLPVAVEVGAEAGGQVEILAGLAQGDEVAVSAQFLLDAEASLEGLLPSNAAPAEAPR